ncbi:MAG: HAMP domain-containing histidine kinase [Proteobacteria bacterium]|nr:HAMP domain-containing histidine kinase [Pseudomonadota bacterium]
MSTARRHWLVVIVIATFLLALAISVQILLSSALDAHRSQKNVAWAAAQLEIEYLQFKHAFIGFAGVRQSVPVSFLETRYSVFQRRIRVLKQETDTTELASDTSYDELIAGLEAVTAAGSPVRIAMDSKDEDAHRAALNQLARLDSPIRSWVQDVMLRSNPDRQKDELIDAEIKAAGVMSVAALSGFTLILLLMRNIRQVEASREREREARLRVDQASRVKDTFLAVVTHELRTPLNAVIGFSELMKSRASKNDDRELVTWIDEILQAGRHLLTLVNQTIDMSKISAGKLALSPAAFDLRLLVADSVTSIKRQIHHDPDVTTRHEVTTTLPAQDIMIYADEAWLRQALFNTILHGRKKLSGDKPIEIAVSHRGGRAHITISHSGHAQLEHVPASNDAALDPFTQGELGLSRGAHGLGLEMPIAKAIVEAHDGSLHYEATANSFRVSIELPLNLVA